MYVFQPRDVGDGSRKVRRLRKAVYGLKQAAREWHKVLVALLHDLDFVRCASDPALYVQNYGRCILLIWVDDLPVFTTADVMNHCVTWRKQHRPGIAPNDNKTPVPTAGSCAALTKPNHTPTRHPYAKGKIILQMVTPHTA